MGLLRNISQNKRKSESVIYLSSRIVKVNLDHLIQNPWTNSYCRKDIKISVSIWKCMLHNTHGNIDINYK